MDFNDFLTQCCHRTGNKNFLTLLEWNEQDQQVLFKSLTALEFHKLVNETSSRLELSQLQNHKVAFFSENSVDLLVVFFACLSRGAQVCLLDNKLTHPEIDQILSDFQPDFLFVDSKKWVSASEFTAIPSYQIKMMQIQDLKNIPLSMPALIGRISSSKKDDPQILVYTSGTSGTPKGVVLDISTIYFEVQSLRNSFHRDYSKRKGLSILPLNHIYGLIALFMSLWMDQEILLTQSIAPTHIRHLIQEKKPNYLYVVPQFLSLIKNRVMDGIQSKPPAIRRIALTMLAINKYLKSSWIAERFFGEIRSQIGSSIEFFNSGGAPLSDDIFDFFEAIKMPVCNGYGLSETGPVISSNSLEHRRRGSVGKVIDGVEVKIEPETHEILVKGPNVFHGYFGKAELTQTVFTPEGWFKTGDLGYIDRKGYLFINGRSKNMIVLPSGKKVQPEEIEGHFSKLAFIKNCCLIYGGPQQKAQKLHLVVEVHSDVSLENKAALILALQQHSQTLASFKRPQEYQIRHEPLPMTTTLKLKRFLVQREIEA
jgi:long-chain acyl-CoA synthetase